MKTHLSDFEFASRRACNTSEYNNTLRYSKNYADVTCENCKKTNAYRYAKAEQKRKDVEELKAEINGKAIVNTCTPKTYKQKIEIEIDVPVGFEISAQNIEQAETNRELYCHFKKKAKTGSELVGCLCGVSGISLNKAEKHAKNLSYIAYIKEFNNDKYYASCGEFTHAYPVPLEKLDELKVNLFSEVIK